LKGGGDLFEGFSIWTGVIIGTQVGITRYYLSHLYHIDIAKLIYIFSSGIKWYNQWSDNEASK
jgi:hypothetical protein